MHEKAAQMQLLRGSSLRNVVGFHSLDAYCIKFPCAGQQERNPVSAFYKVKGTTSSVVPFIFCYPANSS